MRRATMSAINRRAKELHIKVKVASDGRYEGRGGTDNLAIASIVGELGLPRSVVGMQCTAYEYGEIMGRFPEDIPEDVYVATIAHEMAHIVRWRLKAGRNWALMLMSRSEKFLDEYETSELAYEMMHGWGYEVTDQHIALWNLSIASYALGTSINPKEWTF